MDGWMDVLSYTNVSAVSQLPHSRSLPGWVSRTALAHFECGRGWDGPTNHTYLPGRPSTEYLCSYLEAVVLRDPGNCLVMSNTKVQRLGLTVCIYVCMYVCMYVWNVCICLRTYVCDMHACEEV